MPDDAVRNLIRQGKVEQIYSVMQTGTAKGMQTMEQSLAELILRGVITKELGPVALVAARAARGPARARRLRRPEEDDANETNGHQPAPAAPDLAFSGLRVTGS